MNKEEILKKITEKKEFSELSKKDVEIALSHFERRQTSEEEKIRLTRDLLHKSLGSFGSRKLFSPKNKGEEWILKKHLSTRERFSNYNEIYKRIFKGLGRKISIIDLGAGVNGFSYKYFKELGLDVDYVSVESVGQLVDLTNDYFKKEKIKGKAIHVSLFELDKIKKIIKETEKPRVVFLFKVLDSLEMLKADYPKEIISEISSLADKIVVSFATESMIKRKKFRAKRTWFLEFLEKNFSVLDDFELGKERYFFFSK